MICDRSVELLKSRPLGTNCDGSAAVEFALVGSSFVMTLMSIFSLGLVLFMNQTLDFALSKSARQVMTGVVQSAALSQTQFRTNVVCSYLPASFNCNNVIVNLQTVTEAAQPNGYYSLVNANQTDVIAPNLSNSSTSYSTGVQASYEYLQVIYPLTFLPSFFTKIFSGGATFNGSPAVLLTATIAFRNENY